jgi:hypothetical protein
MRNLIVASIFSLLIIGCKKESNPISVINPPSSIITTLSDSVSYTLEISSLSYSSTDTLKGTFTVRNESESLKTFMSGDSPIFGWTIKNDNDSIVINHQGGFMHHTTTFTIVPKGDTTFIFQSGLANLSSGNYQVYAGLLSIEELSLAILVK